MEIIEAIVHYLSYYKKAQTVYNVHSPYATALINAYSVHSAAFSPYLNQIRKSLLTDQSILKLEDYGAGSRRKYSGQSTTAEIASRSLSSINQIGKISNLASFVNPRTVLELGSSFGISCLHLQAACPEADIFTIEGNPSIAAKAQVHIDKSPHHKKPNLIIGQFQEVLPALLGEIDQLDLVFIDGDHTLSGTLSHLQLLLPFVHEQTIILIHDIYWSAEMRTAWQKCMDLPDVTMSLDFFDLGVLIFGKSISIRQHLTIIPYWQKPWQIGLFG